MTALILRTQSSFWSLRAIWPPLFLALACLAVLALSPPLWLGIGALAGFSILMLDAVARLRQYRDLRRVLRAARGLTGRGLVEFRRARTSWCTRSAALAAAQAEGWGREARALVAKWGYKPWHVFPDKAFTRHSPFLKNAFWRSVLGLR
ncbi:hypothetical protein [Maricaulis parjimensis]|uniref:hypothetical protein n=1 Tax=Maricaulis parjimensis TaxID=144023 RepID=UPI001939EBAB|nr:hypothetical protein [Maricaulis parjimensis]